MKKMLLLALGFSLTLSACMPAFLQQSPNPAPTVDLNGTAAVLVQSSLEAMPTPTVVPSNTPVVKTETGTDTPIPATSTETQNASLLTLTATLGTGTINPITNTPGPGGTPTVTATGTLPTSTPSATPNPIYSVTPSGTLHPQHYGTMPPDLPFGQITLINRSKVEAYISLQCTTKDGYVTIIEYPVGGSIEVRAPAGKYVYVAWVGGKKMVGNFGLDRFEDISIKIYKDKIVIGRK